MEIKVAELAKIYLALEKWASAKRKRKWEKETENYVIERLREIPKSERRFYKWRRKVIVDKEGHRHVLTLACRGGKCVATSLWHPKYEPMARKAKIGK